MLERIKHVVLLWNDRLTKLIVVGWYEGLKGKDKKKGVKVRTVLYWKIILMECGVD